MIYWATVGGEGARPRTLRVGRSAGGAGTERGSPPPPARPRPLSRSSCGGRARTALARSREALAGAGGRAAGDDAAAFHFGEPWNRPSGNSVVVMCWKGVSVWVQCSLIGRAGEEGGGGPRWGLLGGPGIDPRTDLVRTWEGSKRAGFAGGLHARGTGRAPAIVRAHAGGPDLRGGRARASLQNGRVARRGRSPRKEGLAAGPEVRRREPIAGARRKRKVRTSRAWHQGRDVRRACSVVPRPAPPHQAAMGTRHLRAGPPAVLLGGRWG